MRQARNPLNGTVVEVEKGVDGRMIVSDVYLEGGTHAVSYNRIDALRLALFNAQVAVAIMEELEAE